MATDHIIRTSERHYANQTVESGYALDIIAGGALKLAGVALTPTAAEINAIANGAAMLAAEVTLTETTGAGVYTATVAIPAGATIQDITVNAVALWAATASATLTVGDAGAAGGYFTGVDLKAVDLLAGESISFAMAGGKAGTYIANSQVSPRYAVAARVISVVVTTVGAAGATGVTRATVLYSLPTTATAAVKV